MNYVDSIEATFAGAELCEALPPTEILTVGIMWMGDNNPILPGWQCAGDQTQACFGATGTQVLTSISYLYPTVNAEVDVWTSIGILFAIAGGF